MKRNYIQPQSTMVTFSTADSVCGIGTIISTSQEGVNQEIFYAPAAR